jgi:ribose/xylose/arabinose/galactoside ABC-type transport system permease subunit
MQALQEFIHPDPATLNGRLKIYRRQLQFTGILVIATLFAIGYWGIGLQIGLAFVIALFVAGYVVTDRLDSWVWKKRNERMLEQYPLRDQSFTPSRLPRFLTALPILIMVLAGFLIHQLSW